MCENPNHDHEDENENNSHFVFEALIENLDERGLGLLALASIGGFVQSYVDEGFCDPAMYEILGMAEQMAKKYGEQTMADKFATLRIEGGEIVTQLLRENQITDRRFPNA